MAIQSVVSLILRGADDGASAAFGAVGEAAGSLNSALLGAAAGGLAVITAATVGVGAAALNLSSDINQAGRDIQAQLGVTAEAAEELAGVAVGVFRDNFGDSMAEAAAGVTTVRRNIDRFGRLAASELEGATERAFALRDAFGFELAESSEAAAALMENFGLTADQAFDFVTAGAQRGLDRSGDFLDTIREYSNLFAEAEADAGFFFSLLDTGLQTGVLGTDKAADLFKEFTVRIQDGSKSTADGLAALGLNVDEVSNSFAHGDATAAEMFDNVLRLLMSVEDENVRFQAGVALLGTQYEDLGWTAVNALDTALLTTAEISEVTGDLNVQYDNFRSLLSGVGRQALIALTPLTDIVLELGRQHMPAIQAAVSGFGEQLAIVVDLLAGGDVRGALAELFGPEIAGQAIAIGEAIGTMAATLAAFVTGSVIPFAGEHSEALKGALVAIGVVLGGAALLGGIAAVAGAIAALANPITATVAVVGILGAAWASNWGGIQDKVNAVIAVVGPLVADFVATLQAVTADGLAAVGAFWAEHGEAIMLAAGGAWDAIAGIVERVTGILSSIFQAYKSAFEGDWFAFGEGIATAWRDAWQLVEEILSAADEALLSAVSALVGNVRDAWSGIDWPAVGSAIIDGIGHGMAAAGEGLVRAARQVAQNALDAMAGFLSIDSPSRVAADEIGRPLGEGVAVGMAAGLDRALPGARRALASFAHGLESEPAGRGGGRLAAAPAAVTYQIGDITINDPETGRLFMQFVRSEIDAGALAAF